MWPRKRDCRGGSLFGTTMMGLNKARGQCWIYEVVAGEDYIVVMPDDVHPRHEWLIAFEQMGVRVFSE